MNFLDGFLNDNVDKYISLRRHIHKNPEVGLETPNTSALIIKLLEEYGYEVTSKIGGHGVVGTLKHGTGKLRLALRADIDALPMQEKTGAKWQSKTEGFFHGCGHDGHTAILLLAAEYLSKYKPFNGTLHLIFQPGEELLYGGKAMINDGLFEQFPCDAIFALHNMPSLKEGSFNFCKNSMMASSDALKVTVYGVGGHGAIPEKTIDATMVACQIVVALQTVVSRNVSPFDSAVVTVGSIHSGSASNIISESAILEISLRSLNPQVRNKVLENVKKIITLQAESFNSRAEIEITTSCPVLVNDSWATDFSIGVAKKIVAEDDIELNTRPMMGSEDFSYMLERIPRGSYCFIGAGDTPDCHMVHNSKYDFNDNIIKIGAKYWSVLVNDYLK